MKNIIFVFFSLLVALAASDPASDHAATQFLSSLLDHIESQDYSIFDDDFSAQIGGRSLTRDEYIAQFEKSSLISEFAASFSDDGLLNIKFYDDNQGSAWFTAKPDSNIKGGYKFLKYVRK